MLSELMFIAGHFKHPQPIDFFRTMNDAAGDDLNWFWKEWFYETWKLDQAVKSVKYVNDNPADGALITIENKEKMALPVTVKVTEENGQTQTLKLPVNVWQRDTDWTFKYNSTSKITSVVLDPDGELPDIDRKNNTVGREINRFLLRPDEQSLSIVRAIYF